MTPVSLHLPLAAPTHRALCILWAPPTSWYLISSLNNEIVYIRLIATQYFKYRWYASIRPAGPFGFGSVLLLLLDQAVKGDRQLCVHSSMWSATNPRDGLLLFFFNWFVYLLHFWTETKICGHECVMYKDDGSHYFQLPTRWTEFEPRHKDLTLTFNFTLTVPEWRARSAILWTSVV